MEWQEGSTERRQGHRAKHVTHEDLVGGGGSVSNRKEREVVTYPEGQWKDRVTFC